MIFLIPDDLFEFYRTTFLPAYSDVVGFTATKPRQVLTEIENTLAHLAQYHNPKLNAEVREENLRKGYDHLTRVTLDCYKLLWIEMNQQLKDCYLDEKKRVFALNISEDEFIKRYNNFKEKAQHARRVELIGVGDKPLEAVELYKNAIAAGRELINNIDPNKLDKLKKFRRVLFLKENVIAMCIGFFAGLMANAFWNYIANII